MVFDLLDLMLSNLRLDLIAGDLLSEMGLYGGPLVGKPRSELKKAII